MHISDSEPIYSIGVAAGKLRIAVPTLHLYDKEGLIVPFRTSTKRRLYSMNDLRIIETVQHLIHGHGLNFAGIRRLMAFLPCWEIRRCNPSLYQEGSVLLFLQREKNRDFPIVDNVQPHEIIVLKIKRHIQLGRGARYESQDPIIPFGVVDSHRCPRQLWVGPVWPRND